MPKILEHENGFLREDDSDRARFGSFDLNDWKAIGNGDILVDEPPPDTTSITVNEVGVHDNGYAHAHYFDRRFLVEIEKAMHLGAQKYERDNWRGARDTSRTLSAIIRHAVQACFSKRRGREHHAVAAAINALILWHTIIKLDEGKPAE